MTDDEQPTLADLQAVPLAAWKGLLFCDAPTGNEWSAARERGLVWCGTDPAEPDARPTTKGARYLAALRALVGGLTGKQRSALKGGAYQARPKIPAELGEWGGYARAYFQPADLGRAALLLMEVDRG